MFSPSSEGFSHCAHLDFNDPRARRLFAGQQHRAGHVFRLQHVRVADPFLRPPPAKRKFGLHASGADNTNLDSMNSEFLIQRLRKTDLRELRGTVNRFAPKPMACPMPALAPVIRATFPLSFVVIFSLLCRSLRLAN
jgi:hypothetical protein